MSFFRDEYILSNKGQTVKRSSDLSAVGDFLGSVGESVENFKEKKKKKELEKQQTEFLKSKGSDYALLGPEKGTEAYLSEQASNRKSGRDAAESAARDYREHLYKMQQLRFTSGADYEREVSKTLLGIFGDLERQDRDLEAKKQMNSANIAGDIQKAKISVGPHYFELQQRKEAGKRAAAAIRQFGKGSAMQDWEIEYYANIAQSGAESGHSISEVVNALKEKANKGTNSLLDPDGAFEAVGDPVTPQKPPLNDGTKQSLPLFSGGRNYSGGDQ